VFLYSFHNILPEIDIRIQIFGILYDLHPRQIEKPYVFQGKRALREPFRCQIEVFACMPLGIKVFCSYLRMHAFVPLLDLNANDLEPLRLFIDRYYVRKVAHAVPAKKKA
jgi:hypothetical protein